MEKSGHKKIWKRVRNSIAAFLFLVAACWAFGYLYARPVIETKIKKAFASATGGRYELSFDELKISYSDQGISIKNLHIYPKADSVPALSHTNLMELECSQVSIAQISFWKTFLKKGFSAQELELENPRFSIWKKTDTAAVAKDTSKKQMGNLELHKIRVKNAQVLFKDKLTDDILFQTEKLDMFIDGFGISPDLLPLYQHFTIESSDNSMGIFPGQHFKVDKLFLTGNNDYTGLSASGFDISEIDSSLHTYLKIPDEITFSLDAISLESESLIDLTQQLLKGRTHTIRITKLLLTHPKVAVETNRSMYESVAVSENFNRVSKKLALPNVEHIGIIDGEFLWTEKTEKKPVLQISHINIEANGLRPRLGEKVPLIYSTAEINVGNTVFTYPKAEYSFYADNIHYRSVTDSLKINQFKCLPHKSIDSFYVNKKWREDRFEFYCDTVQFHRLRIIDFVYKDEFNPEIIAFRRPHIKAYTDKTFNHDPSFTKPFPLARLREVQGDYNIGRIIFTNGKATYSEKVQDSPGLGTISLSNANLTITGLKKTVTVRDTAHVAFDCSFGAGSYAEMFIDIPLAGKDEIQYARGLIKNLPFKQLNSITENTVYMGFGGGELDSAWFTFKAVNGKSDGHSVFYYNNLKVKIYKPVFIPAYNKHILMGKGFMTLAANFLINKNNPTAGYSMPGKLAFKRDPLKGPLNFWIKTVMTGLMNTVIDDISELQDLQGEIKSLKSESKTGILSKMKADPIKKMGRRQAREAKKAVKNEDETK